MERHACRFSMRPPRMCRPLGAVHAARPALWGTGQPSQARDRGPRLAAERQRRQWAPDSCAGTCETAGEAVQSYDARPFPVTLCNGRHRRCSARRCKAPCRARRPCPRRSDARQPGASRWAPHDARGAQGADPRARPGPRGSRHAHQPGASRWAPHNARGAHRANHRARPGPPGSSTPAPAGTTPKRVNAAPPGQQTHLAVLGRADARTLFKSDGDGPSRWHQPAARKCPDLSGHWLFPNQMRARVIIISPAVLSNRKYQACILI
jgi:hypothetical protein